MTNLWASVDGTQIHDGVFTGASEDNKEFMVIGDGALLEETTRKPMERDGQRKRNYTILSYPVCLD